MRKDPRDRFAVYLGWAESSECSLSGIARGWDQEATNVTRSQAWEIVKRTTCPVQVYSWPLAPGAGGKVAPVFERGSIEAEVAKIRARSPRACRPPGRPITVGSKVY